MSGTSSNNQTLNPTYFAGQNIGAAKDQKNGMQLTDALYLYGDALLNVDSEEPTSNSTERELD
jgi:hypothetical protein